MRTVLGITKEPPRVHCVSVFDREILDRLAAAA